MDGHRPKATHLSKDVINLRRRAKHSGAAALLEKNNGLPPSSLAKGLLS